MAAKDFKKFKEIAAMIEFHDEILPFLKDRNIELTETNASEMKLSFRKKQEVQQLAKSININDSIQLLEFGKEPAIKISQFSDEILNYMGMTESENSLELLKKLERIMDKINLKSFAQTSNSLIGNLFNLEENRFKKRFGKYQTIGMEMDQIYIEISKIKNEIIEITEFLEKIYVQNFQNYISLEKYIAAGELKLEEMKENELPLLEEKASNGDELAAMELNTMKTGIELLEQRIHDLEIAKMVALQTASLIRTIQRGNKKLIRKMNSAFVTTIPAFKKGLVLAMQAKRQHLVAKSMNELEKRTSEMLLSNSQNIGQQDDVMKKFSGCSSLKMEKMEELFYILIKGMEETISIERENKELREEGKKRLEEIQESFKKWKLNR